MIFTALSYFIIGAVVLAAVFFLGDLFVFRRRFDRFTNTLLQEERDRANADDV